MRKLIDLTEEEVRKLQRLADKENRPFKNYIETVLIKHIQDNGIK